jgi:UDPglucose--hexose-1-phosphate uridylyltransferase
MSRIPQGNMGVPFLETTPHRRRNPLTGEWVLVSPHRALRPWQGQVERGNREVLPTYDPQCYLCPGNERAKGHRNPQYSSTFVFENDFAALRADVEAERYDRDGLLVGTVERGVCRVVCFSPDHSMTLARMSDKTIEEVVETWTREFVELDARGDFRSVLIFENRGEMMGASNPHPHCQIWATESLPVEVEKEVNAQRQYYDDTHACMLCRYLAFEDQADERLICSNDSFTVVTPFWAVWPFETLLISRRHVSALDELSDAEKGELAAILRRITVRYDNLFESPFPYTLGFHQRPSGVGDTSFHLHAHFYPPLLRSATVRKFMVGFEMLGNPQRDITPESAAERLRSISETHYLSR